MLDNFVEEERKMKLLFTSLLSKNYNHNCLFPSCTNNSISSHSISKNILKLLQNENHIITPVFNRAAIKKEDYLNLQKINMSFKKIGLNIASTFNGFCKTHDNDIFQNIDNFGLSTYRDIFLQLYRSANKIFFTKNMVKKAENDTYGYEYYSDTRFDQKMPLNLQNIILFLHDLLIDFPELNKSFTLLPDQVLSLKPFSKNIPIDVQIIYKKITRQYPVALQKDFTFSLDSEFYSSIVIVLPAQQHTSIVILCHPSISSKYSHLIKSEINILNFIESVLISDSEFYLDPILFNSWSKEKVDFLEKDYYFFNERNFLTNYDFSIFDEIRKDICSSLIEKDRNKENRQYSYT